MSASSSFPLTIPVPIAQGGTAATTAAAARTSLSAAQSAANADITSLAAVAAVAYGGYTDAGFRFKSGGNQSGGITETTDFGGQVTFWASNADGQFGWRSTNGSLRMTLTAANVLTVAGDTINQATQKTPASAAAAGTAGDICHDANFLYICTATNTWKRVAISTW